MAPHKVLIALPPAMLEQVDQIAKNECRTRSDLVRESLRRYIANSRGSAPISMSLPVSTPVVPLCPGNGMMDEIEEASANVG